MSLRRYNLGAAFFHATQAALIVALPNGFSLPVTATYLEGPPGTTPSDAVTLFETPIGLAVAGFLALSAAAHLIIVSPWFYPWYERNLALQRNEARWVEYAISSSIMIVLIAQLTGISDITAIIAIFGVNAAMILFGLLVEHYESPGRPSWMSYWFGVLAGAVPWLVIGVYIFSPGTEANPPTFVYAIFISLFIFFNSFAVNMVLQYRRVGRWADYLFGEKAYIVLSLTSKSVLAWQVFGGTLAS